MDLTPYLETMRAHLLTSAAMGSEETQQLARRLADALEPGARLALTDALSAFAAEVTAAWGGGVVDVRLHDGQPEVVVIPAAPADDHAEQPLVSIDAEGEGGSTARISLRLPEPVKSAAEDRANDSALSLNAWLNRTIASALSRATTSGAGGANPPGRRVSGYHRS